MTTEKEDQNSMRDMGKRFRLSEWDERSVLSVKKM